MKKIKELLITISVAFSLQSASAAEFVISQKGKTFTPHEVNVQVGDTLVFINDDLFAHTVIATETNNGNDFELQRQVPGEKSVMTVKAPGEFIVTCIIHPNMKLRVIAHQ